MKLVAILRIKDQILTIDECLLKLSELVDEIIVLDNGSADGTLEAYAKYPKIVGILSTEGFDEGRDKVMLLEAAKGRSPDWIIWIDGDEVFEKHMTRRVVDRYMNSRYNRVTFRMCNFWLSKTRCRYDSEYYLYTLHPQRSMWRNVPGAYFRNVKIHNGDIMGVPGKAHISSYRIKHYGYVVPKKITEKVEIYSKADTRGDRDYVGKLNPNIPFKSFKFYEFDNAAINYCYIFCYKYVCTTLWILERLKLKLHSHA